MAGCRRSTAPRSSRTWPISEREWRGRRRAPPREGVTRFPDFKEALAYTNRVGELAESVGHHPDIHLAWGKVRLIVWTHKIDGLNEADFVFAAKADREFGS